MTPSVFQEWLFATTMQQQSVLVLACRGPDGVKKFHATKLIVARYRASVMKAASASKRRRPAAAGSSSPALPT